MKPKETHYRGHVRTCQLLFAACVGVVCVVFVLGLTVLHLPSNLVTLKIKRMPEPYMDTRIQNERRIQQKEQKFRRHQGLFAVRNITSNTPRQNKCLSVFSLGAVRPEMSNLTLDTLGYLRALKTPNIRSSFLRQEAYSVLSFEIPRITFNVKNRSDLTNSRSGRGRLKQLNGQLPHLPCRLREYSSAELRQCVVNRRKHGKATHAFFVGDSRIRQFVEVFLDVFRDLKFRIATFEGPVIGVDDFLSEDVDFLWTKYKREFEARSTELPDLRVDFYWTSLMGVKTKLALSQPYQNQKIFSAAEKRFQNRLMQRSQLLNLNTIQRNKSRRNSSKHAGQPSLNYTAVLNEHPDASFKIQTHSENNTRSQSPFVESNGSGREKYQNLKTFKSEPLERLRNISRMEKNKVPDIIFLGTGIWSLDHQYEFQKVFDEVTLDQIELLRPTLREVAKKTDVVWVMAPPISDNVFLQPIERILSSSVFNKYQEWITSAQMKAFNSEGIPVWDSLQPVAYASISDCATLNLTSEELPKQPRLLYRRSWDCADRVHTNNEAVVVAIHMILNYLCNEYLPPEDYCCHQTS